MSLLRSAPLLAALVGLSAFLRTRALGDSFWIDEGLTAGISAQPLLDIPELLRLDGSPPLYYLLLHGWLAVVGDGDAAARALSLVFALATIPVAWWAGRTLFGVRAGWIAALLAAVNPFLTFYAQELRMYALVALLSVIAATAYVRGFVRGERAYVVVFAVALTLLLYTHNWGLFFALGAAAALPATRARPRDAVHAFGAAALAFTPWLPTLLFQARHTGAPWANDPPLTGALAAVAFVAAGVLLARRGRERATAAVALMAGVTLGTAWIAALVEPMWATRYAAVLAGPLVLGAAALLARGGRLALGALAVVIVSWLVGGGPAAKSNVEQVAATIAPSLRAGDLVVSTQPEQVPTLHRYLGDGVRYASPLGVAAEPYVMDWRDALARLRAGDSIAPLLATVGAGERIVLVEPELGDGDRWQAAWTRLVHERTRAWRAALDRAEGFELVARAPTVSVETSRTSIRATVYRRVA